MYKNIILFLFICIQIPIIIHTNRYILNLNNPNVSLWNWIWKSIEDIEVDAERVDHLTRTIILEEGGEEYDAKRCRRGPNVRRAWIDVEPLRGPLGQATVRDTDQREEADHTAFAGRPGRDATLDRFSSRAKIAAPSSPNAFFH